MISTSVVANYCFACAPVTGHRCTSWFARRLQRPMPTGSTATPSALSAFSDLFRGSQQPHHQRNHAPVGASFPFDPQRHRPTHIRCPQPQLLGCMRARDRSRASESRDGTRYVVTAPRFRVRRVAPRAATPMEPDQITGISRYGHASYERPRHAATTPTRRRTKSRPEEERTRLEGHPGSCRRS